MLRYQVTRTKDQTRTLLIPRGGAVTLSGKESVEVWMNEDQAAACAEAAGFDIKLVPEPKPKKPTPEAVSSSKPKPPKRSEK